MKGIADDEEQQHHPMYQTKKQLFDADRDADAPVECGETWLLCRALAQSLKVAAGKEKTEQGYNTRMEPVMARITPDPFTRRQTQIAKEIRSCRLEKNRKSVQIIGT